MTSTEERLKEFHKQLGKEKCQEFECELQTLVMDLFTGLGDVFVDNEEKKEYIIHVFATAIDNADDMVDLRIGQLN